MNKSNSGTRKYTRSTAKQEKKDASTDDSKTDINRRKKAGTTNKKVSTPKRKPAYAIQTNLTPSLSFGDGFDVYEFVDSDSDHGPNKDFPASRTKNPLTISKKRSGPTRQTATSSNSTQAPKKRKYDRKVPLAGTKRRKTSDSQTKIKMVKTHMDIQ